MPPLILWTYKIGIVTQFYKYGNWGVKGLGQSQLVITEARLWTSSGGSKTQVLSTITMLPNKNRMQKTQITWSPPSLAQWPLSPRLTHTDAGGPSWASECLSSLPKKSPQHQAYLLPFFHNIQAMFGMAKEASLWGSKMIIQLTLT